jgi:hypothetical protein
MPQQKYAIRCSTEEQAKECIKSIHIELDEPKERLDIHLSRFDTDKRLPIILCKSWNNIVCNVWESMNKRPEDNWYTIITYEEAKEKGLLGDKQQYVSEQTTTKPVYQYKEPQQNEVQNYMQCDDIKPIQPSQITTTPCPKCWYTSVMWEYWKFHEVQESPSEDNLVELIVKDFNNMWLYDDRISEVIKKHLLSK